MAPILYRKTYKHRKNPHKRKILSENLLCVYRYRTITPSSPLINAPAFLHIPGIFSLFTAAFLASAERSPAWISPEIPKANKQITAITIAVIRYTFHDTSDFISILGKCCITAAYMPNKMALPITNAVTSATANPASNSPIQDQNTALLRMPSVRKIPSSAIRFFR